MSEVANNARDTWRESPERKFITAAAQGDLELIKQHLDAGHTPDMTPDGKPSALCYAALNNHVDMAWLLLRRGASINMQDRIGNTACIYAVLSKSSDCLAILMRWGADVSICNWRNKSAFDYCCSSNVQALLRGGRRGLDDSTDRDISTNKNVLTLH